ncbi:hypothetical protein [Glaciecola sp. SC05]|uniref:hypothetical protein n=1 Tax=Glaciecola sp. SC05 TaxID=1987355 RepID=UPI003528553C
MLFLICIDKPSTAWKTIFSLAVVRQKAAVAGSHFGSRLGGFLQLKTQSMTDRFGQIAAIEFLLKMTAMPTNNGHIGISNFNSLKPPLKVFC